MQTNLRRRVTLALLFGAAVVLGAVPVAADNAPAAGKGVAAVLQPFVDRKELAGAVVLVADRERVLDLEAVGYADLTAGRLMPTDALFWIASQSKPITAAALLLLVDDGKVRLDDPVEKYLPEFRNQWLTAEKAGDHVLLKHPQRRVTVRDLLRHTSGMPFRSALEQPTLDLLPLRVGAGSYAMTPLEFEPGSKFQYSNAGFNTAGRIIEVVSHVPYEDFLDKRLFQPLGMKDTTFRPSKEQLQRLARSYRPNRNRDGLEATTIDQLKYPLDDRTREPMPAGGLFSTAADVGRFCQMMLNQGSFQGKQILSAAAVKEMTTRQTGAGVPVSYGLGWFVSSDGYGHGGAYRTDMTLDTKRGLALVFLVQHTDFPGNGAYSLAAFQKAARERFGGRRN